MPRITPQLVGLVLAIAGFARAAAAQCQLEWSSGGPQPQLSGSARCSTQWDPDGAGPAVQRLVVGGSVLKAGSQPVDQRVMTWDGSQWEALGPGPGTAINDAVNALTVWNGLLVAGGAFPGGGFSNIALWDGAAWQPLGSGFPIAVQHLTVWNGNLVAVSQTGGVPIIKTWNGVTWTTLPTPPSLMFPSAAISYQGLLCVAGNESTPTQGVLERWNGTTWQPSIFAQHAINCLAVRPTSAFGGSDTLYVAGRFTSIGGTTATRIAATSGGTAFAWSGVGGGLPAECLALHVRASGLTNTAIVAVVNSTTTPVLQLSGGSFVAMGNAQLNSLAYYGGIYHATSSTAGSDVCLRLNGTQWVAVLGPGLVGEVRALCRSGADMIVGGTILSISGVSMNRIARWDGTAFTPLGTGVIGSSVDALLSLANGDIVAGGLFLQAGATALNHMGRWNGSTWSSFGSGMDQQVLALCSMPNGDLIAGGKFTMAGGVACSHIARWNGTAWSPLGSGTNGDVNALAVRSDGTLFAGGTFTTAGGVGANRVAQWNGTSWLNVGAGTNADVHGLAVRPNDDVVAVGAFTSAGGLPADRCARWTGLAWASMGAVSADTTAALAVFVLPNGDVIAGRGFHPPATIPDDGIARWNGTSWSGIGAGLDEYLTTASVAVRAMALRADGALVVGGTFSVAGGITSRSLAVLSSTCPATATTYGAGCSSAAGPLVITADTLPWISAPFRTTTTGIAPDSLCIGLIGLSQVSIPLAALLAEGQPGCSLLTSLDILLSLTQSPGTASSSFALANDPSLIGVPFFQQTIPFEFDAFGAIVAVRGSNALSLVIGTL